MAGRKEREKRGSVDFFFDNLPVYFENAIMGNWNRDAVLELLLSL